jgi:hypothetical protein
MLAGELIASCDEFDGQGRVGDGIPLWTADATQTWEIAGRRLKPAATMARSGRLGGASLP